MRRLVVLVGLVAACRVDARFATLREDQRPVVDPARIELVTLANGLRVALLRDPRAELASVDLRYDVGVADDPTAAPGLALLLGEVLAAAPVAADALGSGAAPDVDLTTALELDLDRTDFASTMFDVDGALELEARRLETSCERFAPEVVTAAKTRALAALTEIPPSLAMAVWGSDHPYGHGLGDPRAIGAATAQDLCAFYRAHYGPAGATLVVTGAFDANLVARIRRRFERIPRTSLVSHAPVRPLATGEVHAAVWGIAKPTAALVFPMPAQGAPDEVMGELAAREAQTWDKALHVALVGGRRGRALVIALDGDRASDLPRLRDKLTDLVERSYSLASEDRTLRTSEDSIGAAQELDDPFHRGAQLADLVAGGHPLERLARAKAWLDSRLTYHWMRLHVIEATPRVLDLVPATHEGGASIEALADPASGGDRGLVLASAAMPAVPVRAVERPVVDYALANGLRVVLAPDPFAVTVDARLVVPVGSRGEPAPGVAMQAATELESIDDVDYDANEKMQWYAQRPSIQDADVTPGRTRFRVVGFAGLAEWHVWALAFRVTTGRYEHGSGALARWKAHYVPKGATLIVSGGFDPTAMRATVQTWFGSWHAVDPAPVAPPRGPAAPIVELATDNTLALELGFRLPGGATTSRAAALVLVNLLQQRLTDATRGVMDPAVSYDAADRRLVIAGPADPQTIVQALGLVDRELARLRDEEAPADDLERARRIAVANRLGGELGASGRARRLEERALAGEPLSGPDSIAADVKALTPAALRAAATELFARANRDVALHAGRADADRALTALGLDPRTALRR